MSAQTINASEFASAHQQNAGCVIIDLRTSAEHSSERIEPCIHIPLSQFNEASLKAALNERGVAENTPVYLLCQSGIRAHKALCQSADCPWPLIVIDGGLNALKTTGLQTLGSGKNVISLDRQVRITAGLLVILGVLLSLVSNPNFVYLSAFVGAGLVFSGITNTCGMAFVLARLPWNQK